jgi:predicted acetyltransferase
MKTVQTNWDTDWSNCYTIQPKKSRMRMCNACGEAHDIKCFFIHRGGYIGCMINRASRSKSMAKIKGGTK